MTSDINKINEQINDLEYKINKGRSEIKTARVSMFRYFWPFLVLSIAGGLFAYIYSFVYFFSTPPDERVVSQPTVNGALLAVMIIIVVAGIVFARHMADKKNCKLQQAEDDQLLFIKKLDTQLADLQYRKMELMTNEREGGAESEADAPVAEAVADEAVVATPVAEAVSVTPAETAAEETAAPAVNPFVPQYNSAAEIDEELKNLIARRNAIIYAKPIIRRNAFSYFWPFLILSFAAYQAAQQAIMVFGPALPWGQVLDSYYMYYLIPGSAFVLIHIFAGIYARKKRDEQNRKANEADVARNIEDARLRERISELQYKKKQCLK
jgi:hypothetical protein